jgi:hypothetical protein
MKTTITVFIITIFMITIVYIQTALACDWSEIAQNGETYIYPKDCHIKVGKLIKEAELRKEQVEELNKTITLKDLALTKADERIVNWRDTTYKLEERIMKQRKWSAYNDYLYFGGGVILTILSGWAIGQAAK